MSNFGNKYTRPFEPPMPDPLAFFLTWTTYGTWLPGDERGWVDYGHGFQLPDPILKLEAQMRMTEDACILDEDQRKLVEKTIAEHCRIRGWELHAVNCRTNHLHVVVSANRDPKAVRDQFKAWGTRKLKELERTRREAATLARRASEGSNAEQAREGNVEPRIREKWWTERGSRRWIGDEKSLEAAICYVLDGQ